MESRNNALSSNGNIVNIGNADSSGVNVNNWNPDNHNDNIGVCSSRSISFVEKRSDCFI